MYTIAFAAYFMSFYPAVIFDLEESNHFKDWCVCSLFRLADLLVNKHPQTVLQVKASLEP